MEPRARRQLIREHLNNARAALDLGDRMAALREVHAALNLDPEYLAAQALQEQIERLPFAWRAVDPPVIPPPPPVSEPPRQKSQPPRPSVPPPPPPVSAEGWARFERRARVRRIEKRAEAARAAISKRHFEDARAALEEIREMDSAHPDLISLGIELDAAEHLVEERSGAWGPFLVATLVFGALLFGVRQLDRAPDLRSTTSIAPQQPLVAPQQSVSESQRHPLPEGILSGLESPAVVPPSSTVITSDASVTDPPAVAPPPEPLTTPAEPPDGSADDVPVRQVRPPIVWPPSTASAATARPTTSTTLPAAAAPRATTATSAPPTATSAPTAASEQTAAGAPASSVLTGPPGSNTAPPATQPGSATSDVTPAPTPAVSPAVLPAVPAPGIGGGSPRGETGDLDARNPRVSAASDVVTAPVDEDLVLQTLQRYRSAYDSLDARSAQAVWPRVDGAALQRAFDGLQSQRLTFDACEVQIRGGAGSAVCRGSTRYVPKIGNREPRVEPRVWTFGLRKYGDEWQIDTARAER